MKKKIGILLVIMVSLFVTIVRLNLKNDRKTKENSNELKTNTLAFYLEQTDGTYQEVKDIPSEGYIINKEKSACSNGSKVSGIAPNITINNLSKSGTSCYLYFDMYSAKNYILANNEIDMSRISGEYTSTFEEDTAGRIFKGPEDDYGTTTYFFAGASPNNWVQFANKWWRIIRINGNGSVRLIYAGSDATKEPQLTGEDTQIGTSAFNTSYNDNAYVGYMYGDTGQSGDNGYTNTHKNTNNSTIKTQVDTWYNTNLNKTGIKEHIDTNVGFCGDRTIATSSQTWWSSDTKKGYGAQTTAYIGWSRHLKTDGNWNSTQTASLKCNQTNDLYTVTTANKGNKALTYSIGLITSDEVVFAGGFAGTANLSYWLYANQAYWTMSPSCMYASGYASMFRMNLNGILDRPYVSNTHGVRPVINLKADTRLTGIGTTTDPYVVVGAI